MVRPYPVVISERNVDLRYIWNILSSYNYSYLNTAAMKLFMSKELLYL